MFTKKQLRLEKIAARDMLTPKERREKSEAIVRNILADPVFQKAKTVMIYRSVRGEVQLDPLPALAPEKRYVYPLCVDKAEMIALCPLSRLDGVGEGEKSPNGSKVRGTEAGGETPNGSKVRGTEEGGTVAELSGAWRKGPFGIPEPDPEYSEAVAPEEIDLVLCPCSAFDRGHRRLGMGGGYYDRFLGKCVHADIFAVAFAVQEADEVPTEAFDRKIDNVITENGKI